MAGQSRSAPPDNVATVRIVDLSERAAQKNLSGKEAKAFARLSAAQPIGRMPEPCEVAMLALYLCCDEASFITRTDYPMDGEFFNLYR